MPLDLNSEINQIIRQNAEHTKLDNLIQGYRLCARTEGKSLNTIRITTTALKTLQQFLKINGYPNDVTEIDVHVIRGFVIYLQEVKAFQCHPYTKKQDRGLSGHAINCYLRAIRAFWSWLIREEIVRSTPFTKVRIPKPPRKVIATFSPNQLATLLKTMPLSKPDGFRDWLIIMTLLDTGIRAGELIGLKLNDVNLEDGIMKVYGKGSKERLVPVGTRVQRALWKYIQHYRPEPSSRLCPTLFLTKVGNPISVNHLESIIEKYGKKAGIEGVRCSPHTFRHTFAINYLRNGGDVFSLQRILGHASLDIVKLYVNLAATDIKSCHRRFSPADSLGIRNDRYRPKIFEVER